jgi:hypothetical protein
VKRLGCAAGGTGCAGVGGGEKVDGGDGNVGDRVGVAVGALHPANNTIADITPVDFCKNLGLFISCSLRYYWI